MCFIIQGNGIVWQDQKTFKKGKKLEDLLTIAKPSNNSSHNQVSQAESGTLQNGANNHDRRAQEDHFSPAENIADEDGDNSPNETTNIVTGN